MNDARFQQTAHGFLKLTAVRSEAGTWRRCVAGETPHAIVARVMGIDTFSVVTNGELDGLDGLTTGATYGVGVNGTLTIGASPVVARVVRGTTVLVDLTFAAASGSTDLSGVNGAIGSLQTNLTSLASSTSATDASLQEQVTAINASLVGLTVSQLRRYSWSVTS